MSVPIVTSIIVNTLRKPDMENVVSLTVIYLYWRDLNQTLYVYFLFFFRPIKVPIYNCVSSTSNPLKFQPFGEYLARLTEFLAPFCL